MSIQVPVCKECRDHIPAGDDGYRMLCAKEDNCSRYEDWIHKERSRYRETWENHNTDGLHQAPGFQTEPFSSIGRENRYD